MPDLIEKSPLGGRAVTLGATTLSEVAIGPMTSVAPFPGQERAVGKALKPLGLSFPAPNTAQDAGAAALLWSGRDQAFLIGVPAPDFGSAAATTDQTGGWCALRLRGPDAEAALMRLVPIDLRLAAFPPGRCARAPLNHMSMILRRQADGFLILVFRSMAMTAWHELEAALRALCARAML